MTQPTSGVEHSGEEHDSEGHSVAAWTAVGIILVGALVMSLAVVFPSARAASAWVAHGVYQPEAQARGSPWGPLLARRVGVGVFAPGV